MGKHYKNQKSQKIVKLKDVDTFKLVQQHQELKQQINEIDHYINVGGEFHYKPYFHQVSLKYRSVIMQISSGILHRYIMTRVKST